MDQKLKVLSSIEEKNFLTHWQESSQSLNFDWEDAKVLLHSRPITGGRIFFGWEGKWVVSRPFQYAKASSTSLAPPGRPEHVDPVKLFAALRKVPAALRIFSIEGLDVSFAKAQRAMQSFGEEKISFELWLIPEGGFTCPPFLRREVEITAVHCLQGSCKIIDARNHTLFSDAQGERSLVAVGSPLQIVSGPTGAIVLLASQSRPIPLLSKTVLNPEENRPIDLKKFFIPEASL